MKSIKSKSTQAVLHYYVLYYLSIISDTYGCAVWWLLKEDRNVSTVSDFAALTLWNTWISQWNWHSNLFILFIYG